MVTGGSRSPDSRCCGSTRETPTRLPRRSGAPSARRAEPLLRAGLLPALVEIMLAVGDIEEARRACDELGEIAAGGERAMLDAMAAQARGAVELAEGDAQAALVSVRHASHVWQELEAPYEAARTRVLIASACRALGDADSAVLELEAARGVFEQLGASPDVARIDALTWTSRAE